MSRIAVVPSGTTITATGKDPPHRLLLRSGRCRRSGRAAPAVVRVWRLSLVLADDGYLYVTWPARSPGHRASSPQVRWSGDELYFWYADEIACGGGSRRTVATSIPTSFPLSSDDAYFSADAKRFTVTRYSMDGSSERYVGETATGAMTKLADEDATFTEWGPLGETLLVRSNDKLSLIDPSGVARSAMLSTFTGAVHGWTADGRLLVGGVSATVPGGNVFDRIPVWDPSHDGDSAVATLPNLFGIRSFSPDGRWFTGVSRTGLYETQLELYRCGVASRQSGVDLRADPAARSRLGRIEEAPRRFIRPVAGSVSQFLQGSHTGVDIAAPFGSIIVAADDGIVDAAGWVQVGGRRVCVQHADGIESCYYHTSAALVSIGDRVQRGQR